MSESVFMKYYNTFFYYCIYEYMAVDKGSLEHTLPHIALQELIVSDPIHSLPSPFRTSLPAR